MSSVQNRFSTDKLSFTLIPALLSILFAAIWFYPSPDKLVGWGDDPYFNLWTLEHVWRQLSTLGITQIFSAAFWDTPIFYPMPNTLALSENQIFVGLLSWPIRALSGNGVFTLNCFAMLMSGATFVCSALWFRSLGVIRYAFWGALLFQACGWVQSQCAHYQNICIFLFPLAFYAWNYFLRAPGWGRTFFCAFAWGWAMGWNVYFQIFLNLIFGFLLVGTVWRAPSKRPWLAVLTVAIGFIELPFALKYLAVEKAIGSMRVLSWEYADKSASWRSLFGHANHDSLLQRILPFYPHAQVSIETVGFLGFAWIILWLLSTRQPRARIFAAVGLIAFWIGLGPQFGLMTLMKVMPGFHGLRALGRLQVLVALFSLAGILVYLEQQKKRWPMLLFGMLVLELFPGNLPLRVLISKSLFAEPTALERYLQSVPKTEPWLVAGGLTPKLQLTLLRAGNRLYEGYTGRAPLNAQLLSILVKDRTDATTVKSQLIFSGAKHLLSVDEGVTKMLESASYLKFEGCFAHQEYHACVFTPQWKTKEDGLRIRQRRLDLARDTHWIYPVQPKGHRAELVANQDGILDYDRTGKCWIQEATWLGRHLPIRSRRPLLSRSFEKVEFKAGDLVTTRESKQYIFSLPQKFRPRRTYEINCGD
jgi:hypothetical protein